MQLGFLRSPSVICSHAHLWITLKIDEAKIINNSTAEKIADLTIFFREMTVGPLRFELKSIPPQGTRMPSYPTGPKDRICITNSIQKLICAF